MKTAFEEHAQNGVRREAVPYTYGGARRTLCASQELANNGNRRERVLSGGPRRYLFALAILSLFVASLAAPAANLAKSHSEGKFSDAEIEATIKAKLARSKIGKDGFQIHVKDRVATWTGATNVMQHKGAATRMAKTAGATRVINNIKVSEDAAAKAAGNIANPPRPVQVKTY